MPQSYGNPVKNFTRSGYIFSGGYFMKKFAALLLALVMALSLAACGNQNTPATSGSASGSTSGEETNVYNVVYLVNGNLGDKSFFDSAEAGLDQLKADGRITLTTIEMGGLDEDKPKWKDTLYEVSASGEYDVVICGTYQMPDFLKEVADQYPDQKYVIFDDNTTEAFGTPDVPVRFTTSHTDVCTIECSYEY